MLECWGTVCAAGPALPVHWAARAVRGGSRWRLTAGCRPLARHNEHVNVIGTDCHESSPPPSVAT